MNCKAKALGVALIAAVALTAVPASSASAASYTAASYPATATAESAVGNDDFKTEAGSVECKSHFQGLLAAASTSLKVTPTYTECKAFGFLSATVIMNGCNYLFKEPTGAAPSFTAPVDVACAGKVIEISAGTCKVLVGAQAGLNSVAVTNQASGDVLVKAGVTGIDYFVSQDGFGCPFAGTGVKSGGTYTQNTAVTVRATGKAGSESSSFTASSYPTTVTALSAKGNDVFKTEAGGLECRSHFQGTLSGQVSSITITPTYSECSSWSGGFSSTVNMNGCDYLLKEPTTTAPNFTASIDVVCSAGKVIEIADGTCKVTIGQQVGLKNVSGTNQAGGDVLVKAEVSGINYTVVNDGFGCPFSGTGAKTGATYTQSNAVTFDSTNGESIDVGPLLPPSVNIDVG